MEQRSKPISKISDLSRGDVLVRIDNSHFRDIYVFEFIKTSTQGVTLRALGASKKEVILSQDEVMSKFMIAL